MIKIRKKKSLENFAVFQESGHLSIANKNYIYIQQIKIKCLFSSPKNIMEGKNEYF